MTLEQICRFIASHDVGQRNPPRVVADAVEFEISWYRAATKEHGWTTERARSLREARDLLGY